MAFDVRGRLDGRGAYTCAQPKCIALARDKGGFRRAFDADVIVPADLIETVARVLDDEVKNALGLLRRQGAIVPGRTEVQDAVTAERAHYLVLGTDLAERSRREAEGIAAGLPVTRGLDMASIGAAIGRKPTGVVAVCATGPLAARLHEDLIRAARLRGEPADDDASTLRARDRERKDSRVATDNARLADPGSPQTGDEPREASHARSREAGASLETEPPGGQVASS